MTPRSRLSVFALAAGLGAGILPAHAADDPWALCGQPLTPAPVGNPALRDNPETPTHVRADRANYVGGRYTLNGSALLHRADRQVTAEHLQYDTTTGQIAARGDVRFQEAGALLTADTAEVDLDNNTGKFSRVSYRVDAGHLQGDAASAERLGDQRSRYRDVRLSTCNPGEELWWLHAGTLTINQETRQGTAHNAWLSIADVPVFYTPWLRFPISRERMTGLLAPTLGYDSEGGVQLATPWYWNIAPNRDATITPTLYSNRGLMLGGEFRYLEQSVTGVVRGNYLPGDKRYSDDRWSLYQRHRLRTGEHLSAELVQRRVSDSDYLDDFDTRFGDDAFDSAERNLESFARIAWNEPDWTLAADAQAWQTVDPTLAPRQQPYARQPRLSFDYRPLITRLPVDFSLAAEAVEFDHPYPELRTTGSRIDVTPRLALPIRGLSYHFEPAIAWRYTGYRLERPNTTDDQPQRTLPIYSVDAGLDFVRDTSLFGHSVTQTFEPRLYYLRVPKRAQSSLPLFDTDAATLTYSQLFRPNRFTGADRIGDANQLTVGATTRWVDQRTGISYLRFSAGQIFYFDDREVTLSSEPETAERSDYVTELRLALPVGLLGTINYNWDPDDAGNHNLYSQIRWRGGPDTLINLGYRDRRNAGLPRLQQAETNFALPINNNWQLLGGWRWDLDAKRTTERFIGMQYDSCCYAVRLVHHASQGAGAGDSLENQILLQFVLRGLGGLGDTIPQFFEDAVPGYQASRY